MENIPIATNIELQQPDSTNQYLQAIYVQPYITTFQPIYIIDIDPQNTIESQAIEQHQESQPIEPNQQVMMHQIICIIKIIVPIIIITIIIIGIYYNIMIQ